MNIKYITYLISGLFLFFLFPSCNSDNSTTSYGSQTNDAQIYSFSISAGHYKSADSLARATDSIRFLQVNKTRFAINQVSGIIYNPDSLPFGTILRNKVVVTATYNSSGYSNVKITTPDSIKGYLWNNTDSVDFSKTPITFTVTSLNGTIKAYDIDLRVHKIDPDTIVWAKMASYPSTLGSSKTVLVNNQFYTYSVRNNTVSLFTSDKNTINWQAKTVSGLPSSVKPESIFSMNDVFYAILDNGDSYKSNDGTNWAKVNNGKNVVSVTGVLPAANKADDLLLIVVNDGGKYYFGKTKDMASVEIVSHISLFPANNEVPADFPLQKGASFTNYTTDKSKRMLIVTGGLDNAGKEINYTWFIQNSNDGLEMVPSAKNTYFKGAGISNAVYDNKIYALADNQFYIMDNWGSSWNVAPKKQMLDAGIAKRSGQTLIVDSENNIWIFGGVSSNGVYPDDVWKGRLNKLIP